MTGVCIEKVFINIGNFDYEFLVKTYVNRLYFRQYLKSRHFYFVIGTVLYDHTIQRDIYNCHLNVIK